MQLLRATEKVFLALKRFHRGEKLKTETKKVSFYNSERGPRARNRRGSAFIGYTRGKRFDTKGNYFELREKPLPVD